MYCPNCKGSHWLLDNPDLGFCTCLTPQALTDMREMYEDAEAELKVLQDYKAPATRLLNELKNAQVNFEQRDSEFGEAQEALVAYLIAKGYGARPIRVDDADLQRMIDVLYI